MTHGDDGTSLFYEVNDRIRKLAARSHGEGPWEFICECEDDACIVPVRLTLAEYDERRRETVAISAHAGR